MQRQRENSRALIIGVLTPVCTQREIRWSIFGHNSDHRPFARRMRSLSVSDVVVLTQAGKKTAYYTDSVGFKEVPEFLTQKHQEKNKHRERGIER